MTLNPSKCKEMSVDFLQYNSCVLRPVVGGNAIVERVATFQFLGVYISRDLTWDIHVEYILKKANKRLYILRALRRSGVSVPDMANIYCAVIRSVVEYAPPVFSDLPTFLCCALESMQKYVGSFAAEVRIVSFAAVFWMSCNAPPKETFFGGSVA